MRGLLLSNSCFKDFIGEKAALGILLKSQPYNDIYPKEDRPAKLE